MTTKGHFLLRVWVTWHVAVIKKGWVKSEDFIGLAKTSFGFLYKILHKTLNKLFGQPKVVSCFNEITYQNIRSLYKLIWFSSILCFHLRKVILRESYFHTDSNAIKESESCSVMSDPMDYTVQGVLWARILEWVAFPFSRGSSQPREWTQVSCIAGRFLTSWATRGAQEYWSV